MTLNAVLTILAFAYLLPLSLATFALVTVVVVRLLIVQSADLILSLRDLFSREDRGQPL